MIGTLNKLRISLKRYRLRIANCNIMVKGKLTHLLTPQKILLNVKCFTNQQERWQSGRLRYLGKVVTGQLVPGFESPSLRQFFPQLFSCLLIIKKGMGYNYIFLLPQDEKIS